MGVNYACWRRLKLPMPKKWRHSIKETNSNPSVRIIKDCFSELSNFPPPACFFFFRYSLPYVIFLFIFSFSNLRHSCFTIYLLTRKPTLVWWSAKRGNSVTSWSFVVSYNKYICSAAIVGVSEIIVFSTTIFSHLYNFYLNIKSLERP